MSHSSEDRRLLIARVEHHLGSTRVPRAEVERVVDRVLASVNTRRAEEPSVRVVTVTASSMPDLASRLRRALGDSARNFVMEGATEGRHTVVVLRVPAAEVPQVETAARQIGATVALHEMTP